MKALTLLLPCGALEATGAPLIVNDHWYGYVLVVAGVLFGFAYVFSASWWPKRRSDR